MDMTIQLSKDQERFVREAVLEGRFASAEQVVQVALERLRSTEPEVAIRPLSHNSKVEFHRRLIELGLLSRLPAPGTEIDEDPDDRPIELQGEPLSATVMRERR